jgi:ferredoxin-NADP reductase
MTAKLISQTELAPEIREFTFEAVEAASLAFQPGQFASLGGQVGDKSITRAYSLAAPADSSNRFTICLNRVSDGMFSPHLFDLQPGDAVELKGILGTFGWREPAMDSILVATGTGIVPFRAMLLDALPSGASRHITLLYGTRYEETILYRAEFERLAAEFSNFQFLPTLTRPPENWPGLTGRVQPHLLDLIGPRRDLQIYCCGLKEMVDSVRAVCKQLGFDRRQIVYEKYD